VEVCGQLHAPGRFTPAGNNHWYSLNRSLGGLQSRSERSGEEENFCLVPGIRAPDRPAVSLVTIPSTLFPTSILDPGNCRRDWGENENSLLFSSVRAEWELP